MDSSLAAVTSTSDIVPVSNKKFLDIQATIECGFTMNRLRDMLRIYSQLQRTDKYSQHRSIDWPVWLNVWVFVYELSDCGIEPRSNQFNFRYRASFGQRFLEFQATIKCKFTLNHVCKMIKKYSQMHCAGKYSQHSSIIWPVLLNGWMFVYELSGSGFKFRCSYFNFRYDASFS